MSQDSQNQSQNWLEQIRTYFDQLPMAKITQIFNIVFGVLRQFFYIFLIVGLLLGALGAGVLGGYFASIVSSEQPPSFEEMRTKVNNLTEVSKLYYGDGSLIAEVNTDLIRIVVPREKISDNVVNALIAIEDSHFYEHNGVVPKALIRATLQELLGSGSQTGGSTLTQQLIKQQILSNEVTFTRKAKEILLAMRLEKAMTKDEIITSYLNVSSFGRNSKGQNVSGIEAAAQGIFGKSAAELNVPQAAFLAGLPQAPYAYTPYSQFGEFREKRDAGIERMKQVLYAMYRNQKISETEYQEALAYDITADWVTPAPAVSVSQNYLYQAVNRAAVEVLMKQQLAAEGVDWINVWRDTEQYNRYFEQNQSKLNNGGLHVTSTLDPQIYQTMQDTIAANGDALGPTYTTVLTDEETGEKKEILEPTQTGSVVIENATGRILGFIGGRDFSISQLDHTFQTHRSTGSTIKPLLVYAPAVEEKLIYPGTLISDMPYSLAQNDGSVWTPTNPDGGVSNTYLTARYALKMSLNTPTVRLYEALLKVSDPSSYMRKMGITSISDEEYANLATSLGGLNNGPTLAENTSAFTTFANNGVHIPAYLIEKITDAYGNVVYQHEQTQTRVFSPETAFLVRSMLRDSVTGGTTSTFNRFIDFSADFIGKTGTSEYNQDLWVIISTPTVTIGQWMGWDNRYETRYFNNWDSYGPTWVRSQRYWAQVANALYDIRPELFGTDQRFERPDGIRSGSIVSTTGTAPGTIDIGGTKVEMAGPIVTEEFAANNPPKPLSIAFAIGANESETITQFWNPLLRNALESRRKQEEASRSAANSSSSDASGSASSTPNPPDTSNSSSSDTRSEPQ